jgi:hypothetical protein
MPVGTFFSVSAINPIIAQSRLLAAIAVRTRMITRYIAVNSRDNSYMALATLNTLPKVALIDGNRTDGLVVAIVGSFSRRASNTRLDTTQSPVGFNALAPPINSVKASHVNIAERSKKI